MYFPGRSRLVQFTPVLAVTPTRRNATYLVMEVTEGLLAALLTAWRADIDSVPFAHETESETLIQILLNKEDPGL